MKSIIDGKMYDTEKAEKLLEDRYIKIYKTKNDRLFCVINGTITPVAMEEIKECIGIYLPDLYIKHFGEVEEA